MPILPTKTSLISIDLILEKGLVFEGAHVADLGCGRSIFFLYALSSLTGKTGKVFGIDILPEALDSAARDIKHHQLTAIEILKGNLEKNHGVPLTDNSIDSAFLINTLSQSADSLAMLREASRLLKPGGRLVIVDWEKSKSPFGPEMVHRLSGEQIVEILPLASLSKLDDFEAGPYHYGIVATK